LTGEARDVLRKAREEALRLGSPYLGTEHLLLALIQVDDRIAGPAFKNLDVDAARIESEIRRRGKRANAEPYVPGRLPFSPSAQRAIEAAEASERIGSAGPTQLLLALLREAAGSAVQIVTDFGLDPTEIHDMVLDLAGADPDTPRVRRRSIAEALTRSAMDVMHKAAAHARHLGCEFIGREHVLLGILDEGSCGADLLARVYEVDLARLRTELERRLAATASTTVTRGQLPFSPRVMRSLELASEAQHVLAHEALCTEHLALGLLKSIEFDNSGPAPESLQAVGLKLARHPSSAAKVEVSAGLQEIRRRRHSTADHEGPAAAGPS
jgi:ATP-dependent Clp protease ATP-binding subunit ClpA